MSTKPPTLYNAMAAFLGPLEAEYARIIAEGHPDMPVTISLGSYEHKTTLSVIKDMDRAHAAAFEAKIARDARRAKGTLL